MARPPLSSFVGTTTPVANDTSLATSTRPPLASFIKPTPAPVVPEPGFFSRVSTDIKNRGAAAQEAISGEAPQSQGESPLVRGFQAAGEGALAVTDVIGEGLKSAYNTLVPNQIKENIKNYKPENSSTYNPAQEEVRKKLFAAIGDIYNKVGVGADDLSKRFPEIAKPLESLLKISKSSGDISNAILATNQVAQTAQKTAELTERGVKKTIQTASDLKQKISPSPTVDELSGRIAQGDIADQKKFTNGLKNIEGTSKIKTYKELNEASTKAITRDARAQDVNLSKDKNRYNLENFERVIGEGEAAVKVNSVEDALDQLKSFYVKTNNTKGLYKIKVLIDKANSTGLTVKEVNDLARLHGIELNGFNANGELASGLTKQAAENTRVGLKDTIANNITDPKIKSDFIKLDSKISDTFSVKELSGTMAEKVNKLSQRLQQPNILRKLGNRIGRGLRVTGVGDLVSEFIGIDKVPGAQTLDAIELQSRLSKNLKLIEKALLKNDAGFIDDMSSIIQSNTVPNINKTTSIISKDITPKSVLDLENKVKGAVNNFIQDPKLGMSIKDVSKIHPEDLAELRDFTDYVAGTYKPSTSQIVTDARRIAVKYGIISEKLAKNISDKGLSSKITKLGIFKNK